MCGPLVGFCSGGSKASGAALSAYHLSRLACYCLLGALAGGIGAAVDFGGDAAGFGRAAGVVAGLFMVSFGLGSLLSSSLGARYRAWRGPSSKSPSRVTSFLQRAMGKARGLSPTYRSAAVGGLSAFLPCGWLYAFVAASAGTASPFSGALVMAAFWAGTVPILLALGLGISAVFAPLRSRAPAMTAILLVAMGIASIFGRLQVPSFQDAMGSDVGERALAGELDSGAMPCCEGDSEVEATGLAVQLEACGCTHPGPCIAGETCGCPGCGKDWHLDD
ncbi:MAG: sulfite exporter TauE/SafE [Bacteroidia bacterium]|jgi:sulfite exporter TauE/SafE